MVFQPGATWFFNMVHHGFSTWCTGNMLGSACRKCISFYLRVENIIIYLPVASREKEIYSSILFFIEARGLGWEY
jgi:hypothetical protein